MAIKRRRKKVSRKKKWIPKNIKKGALKKQLGYKEDQKIPVSVLNKILDTETGKTITVKGRRIKVTTTLKRRANLAKTFRKLPKRGRKKRKKK